MTEKQFFVICLWVETAGSGAQAFQFLWKLGTAWKIFIISHKCWQQGSGVMRRVTWKLFIRMCLKRELPEMFWESKVLCWCSIDSIVVWTNFFISDCCLRCQRKTDLAKWEAGVESETPEPVRWQWWSLLSSAAISKERRKTRLAVMD